MLSFLTDRFGQTPSEAAEEAVCVIGVCTVCHSVGSLCIYYTIRCYHDSNCTVNFFTLMCRKCPASGRNKNSAFDLEKEDAGDSRLSLAKSREICC